MIQNVLTILFLVLLEGLLSFDNALVLAVLVKHLPDAQRKKALTYGILGAYLFRFMALTAITVIISSPWVKAVGGVYLLMLAYQHFFGQKEDEAITGIITPFWRTILTVELADIAFSSDSILASVAVSNRLWVVVVGGILGITMMRVAAILFIRLVELFPNLERTAYLLVTTVGAKLLLEIAGVNFQQIDISLMFWGVMGVCITSGFLPVKTSSS